MRAVVLTEFGGPEVLRFADIPVPQPDAEEVLVAVRATALNRADLMQRMGLYPNPSPVEHDVPGLEFAGVVTAIGSRVREHAVGDAEVERKISDIRKGVQTQGLQGRRLRMH